MSQTSDNSSQAFSLAGMIWAGILSWLKWHSIGWAVFNSLCGWFYVIYYFIRY